MYPLFFCVSCRLCAIDFIGVNEMNFEHAYMLICSTFECTVVKVLLKGILSS